MGSVCVWGAVGDVPGAAVGVTCLTGVGFGAGVGFATGGGTEVLGDTFGGGDCTAHGVQQAC